MVMGSLHPDVVGCTFMDVEAGSVAECIQRGLPVPAQRERPDALGAAPVPGERGNHRR
jgi:hypothetical protein